MCSNSWKGEERLRCSNKHPKPWKINNRSLFLPYLFIYFFAHPESLGSFFTRLMEHGDSMISKTVLFTFPCRKKEILGESKEVLYSLVPEMALFLLIFYTPGLVSGFLYFFNAQKRKGSIILIRTVNAYLMDAFNPQRPVIAQIRLLVIHSLWNNRGYYWDFWLFYQFYN